MLNKQFTISAFFLFLLLLFSLNTFSQARISLKVNNQPLNKILSDVSDKYKLRFAFNDDLLSQINTSLTFNSVGVDEFLQSVCDKFGLRYKLIGGTYVFYVDDEIKIVEAIKASVPVETPILEEKIPLPEPEEREYTIKGIVKNAKTGEKLNYCDVVINDEDATSTNEMGFFNKIIVSEGEATIKIRHLGYIQLDTTLKITNTDPIELLLDPILFIQAKNNRIQKVNYITSMTESPELVAFDPKTTLQVPAVESNDLVNALTIIPGINYLKGTDTGLSIRGGAPSDNLVLIDGIPIIETSHLMGNLSVLNAKYIQQAFVSRGGFGAEYGGRTSGIVDLTGKSGNNIVPVVDFTANLLHTNIYVGLPVSENASLSGSFKKSFVDVWSPYLINNFALENMNILVDEGSEAQAVVDETNVNYSDANLKLSIRPTNRSEVTVNYFSSYDSQQRNYTFPVPGKYFQNNYSNSKTSGFSFNYKDQRREGWMNTVSVGYNKMDSESEFLYSKETAAKDQLVKSYYDADNIAIQEVRANWKSEIKLKKITQKFGLGFNSNNLNYQYQDHEKFFVGANSFNDSISSLSSIQLANAYYQMQVAPLRWVNFRGGVRALYDFDRNTISVQPRYGIEFIPLRNLKLYYSGGRYMQHMYLAYRIDSYKNASSIWYIPQNANENLDAIHHITGIRYESDNLLFNIEAYNKNNNNKIYFIGEKGLRNGLDIVDYQHLKGNELNRGVDVFLQYRNKNFKHLLSYSYSQSLEHINEVNNGDYFPSFDDQLHRLRLTEIVTFGGWTASANWYYATGTPYLLAQSSSTQLDFARHTNFMQLDLSLVKQFNFQNFYADLGITVLNVFDQRNELQTKNIIIPEGSKQHLVTATTTATSFSPLFYINLRYE